MKTLKPEEIRFIEHRAPCPTCEHRDFFHRVDSLLITHGDQTLSCAIPGCPCEISNERLAAVDLPIA